MSKITFTDDSGNTLELALPAGITLTVAPAPPVQTAPKLVQAGVGDGATSTSSVTLSTAPVAGNTLVMVLLGGGTSTPGLLTGWSAPILTQNTATRAVYMRVADGTEGTTIQGPSYPAGNGIAVYEFEGPAVAVDAGSGIVSQANAAVQIGGMAAPTQLAVPLLCARWTGASPTGALDGPAAWNGEHSTLSTYPYYGGWAGYSAPTADAVDAISLTTSTSRGDGIGVNWQALWAIVGAPPLPVGASAPPTSPSPTSPAPPPAPPAPTPSAVPLSPQGTGANQVKVTVTPSNGTVWTGVANVGSDPTVASIYCALVDANGIAHPGLTMHAWADGMNVCAGRADNAYGYVNCRLQVEYNGVSVFDQTVDFHRGVANATIRYGTQAAWHTVDANLVPVYGTQTAPYDDSKFDHSYNGLGTATTADMSSAGERDDIAPFPSWDVPFLATPSDATFAVVRRAADGSGAWPIYFFEPATGQPLDVTQYPAATLMSYSQAQFAGNPIVAYGGDYDGDTLDTSKVAWNISGCGRKWDVAHSTNYNAAAALATGTARDREHMAFHANAVLLAINPTYYQQSGFFSNHYEERATAWSLRHLFYGAKASSLPDYFQGRLDLECTRATALIGSNPFGIQGTQFPPPVIHEVKPWEENYTRMVVGLIAHTDAKWVPYAQYLGKALAGFLAHVCWFMSTIYVWRVLDDNGAYYTTWDDLVSATLTAPTAEEGPAWPAADAAQMIDPATTDAQRWAISKSHGNTAGLGDFWPSSSNPSSPDNYISGTHAAVASLVEFGGMDAAWKRCISTPTQPDFSENGKHNILPRAA